MRRRLLFARDAFRPIAGSFRRVLLGPKKAVATIRWYAPGRLAASRLRETMRARKDIVDSCLNVEPSWKWLGAPRVDLVVGLGPVLLVLLEDERQGLLAARTGRLRCSSCLRFLEGLIFSNEII